MHSDRQRSPVDDPYSNLWGGENYGNAILNDATVSPLVTIIATHDYDNASSKSTTRPAPPAGANSTHHLWETEATHNSTGAGITPGGANAWRNGVLTAWTAQRVDLTLPAPHSLPSTHRAQCTLTDTTSS